jgi:hypothetical protein
MFTFTVQFTSSQAAVMLGLVLCSDCGLTASQQVSLLSPGHWQHVGATGWPWSGCGLKWTQELHFGRLKEIWSNATAGRSKPWLDRFSHNIEEANPTGVCLKHMYSELFPSYLMQSSEEVYRDLFLSLPHPAWPSSCPTSKGPLSVVMWGCRQASHLGDNSPLPPLPRQHRLLLGPYRESVKTGTLVKLSNSLLERR